MTTEPTHAAPTLPTLELPDYHGRKPAKMKTAISGAGSRITRPHSIGDKIVLVVEVRVKSAGHEDTDDGLEYVEKYKVLDLFELESDQGSRLISTVRSLYRTADDAVKGRRPIPDLGDVGYTDGSGVVLTEAEVAALRGDLTRATLSDDLTPAVVVYDDGARDLWPDDYPKDSPRPRVGESFSTTEGTGPVVVVELLHHETGETIETTPARNARNASMSAASIVDDEEFTEKAKKPKPVAAVPDLPAAEEPAPESEPDPFSGDLGDAVDGWDDDIRPTALREVDEVEASLPTADDFKFVDQDITTLRIGLTDVEDLAHLRRIEMAEQQGRGRALLPRKGALAAIRARIGVIELSAISTEAE